MKQATNNACLNCHERIVADRPVGKRARSYEGECECSVWRKEAGGRWKFLRPKARG